MSFYTYFGTTSRAGNAWFLAGLATSYPNITTSSSTSLSDLLPCKDSVTPGCKVFHVSPTDSANAVEVVLDDALAATSAELGEQVVVFQYQGKFHAVDHVSIALFSSRVCNRTSRGSLSTEYSLVHE